MHLEEEDRTIWAAMTTFPEMNIAMKFAILVLNVFFPGIVSIR